MDKSKILVWEKERQEWVKTVGEFILACGEIEARTFEMLDDLFADDIPSIIKNMKFEQRNQFILALIDAKVNDKKLKTAIKEALSEARNVMGVRNIIAHNPLDLKIIGDSVGIDTEQVIRRYYGDSNDYEKSEYTLAKLDGVVGQAQLLYRNLREIAYKLRLHLENGS